MDDGEILDQLSNLRLALSLATEEVAPDELELLLTACSIFIAGFDAMLSMRKES